MQLARGNSRARLVADKLETAELAVIRSFLRDRMGIIPDTIWRQAAAGGKKPK
jgi:hypothetical protein